MWLAVVTNRDASTEDVGHLGKHIRLRIRLHPTLGAGQCPCGVGDRFATPLDTHCVHDVLLCADPLRCAESVETVWLDALDK